MSIYIRLAGGFQVLFASIFCLLACQTLELAYQTLDVVAQKCPGKCLYHSMSEIESGTAFHTNHADHSNLALGAVLALLSLLALIGGCGLLGHQPWARYWEIAYLTVVSTCSLVMIAIEAGWDQGPWLILFITMIFALPYLPFILPEPFEFSRTGRVP